MSGCAARRARRFLVIQLRQIGDVVLTTPIVRILKEAEPGCRVAFLTERPSDQYLQGNPHIDDVLLNERRGSWLDTLRLARTLRRERFDVVIDCMGNPRTALLALATRAPMRVAYQNKGRGFCYTHRVRGDAPYAVEVKKCLLRPLGIESAVDRPEIYLTERERAWAAALRHDLLQGEARHLITVDPSHRRETRRWPAENFGRLCGLLARQLAALPVVLWGPGEEPLADQVVAASRGGAVKAPATRLREMAALIAAADLHLGNCSAPRHVAVAVGTPTYTVLGSTSVGWTHPAPEHDQIALDLDCQPCDRNDCPRELACLVGLDADQVFAELRRWAGEALGWKCRGDTGDL